MADQPLTEIETKNDEGSPLPSRIIGATDSTPIGNNLDALKVSITSEIITSFSKTYTAAFSGLLLATNPTDFLVLQGSATRKVRLASVSISAVKNNTGYVTLEAILRSAANTGGTSTLRTAVRHESTDAAATALVSTYTANPTTLGEAIGVVESVYAFVPSATANSSGAFAPVDISKDLGKPITLINNTEFFVLNLGGQTVAGMTVNGSITWIEE